MWVLLLLGLLPLAVLPTMLGDGPQDGDATDDDDSGAGRADDAWPDNQAPDDGWAEDGVPDEAPGDAGSDEGSGESGDADGDALLPPDLPPDDGAGDTPVPPATFVLAPGDAPASFAGFVPGTDRVEVHIDPDGPPAEVTSGQDGGGSWVRVAQGDIAALATFPDLAEPPTGDVHLVTEPLEPDVSDDSPGSGGSASGGDDAPLAPVTDQADVPAPQDDNDSPVLAPVVPPEGAP